MRKARLRKRISQACQQCGSKKIKCDGASPSCGSCLSKGVTCTYGISRRNTRIMRDINTTTLQPQEESSPSIPRSSVSRSIQSQGGTIMDEIGHSPFSNPLALPPHVSNHLFRAYFSCIHPIWPLLYKSLYDTQDYQRLIGELPKALVFAIFSIAVSVQDKLDNEDARSFENINPELFFEAAIRALEGTDGDDHRKPVPQYVVRSSITHCQVFAILALQQLGVAEFSQAGILCGLASSIAIDLRLHRRATSQTNRNLAEKEIKSRLWWTIYTLDQMLACEMGRPSVLRYDDSDAPFPSVEESDEYELYYRLPQDQSNSRSRIPLKLHTLSAFHTSIKLGIILEHISTQVYSLGNRERIRLNREFGEETRLRLWLEIQEWETSMQASPLKLDLSDNFTSVPVTITNYVFMWFSTILLHRPFTTHWQSRPEDSFQQQSTSDPFMICVFASNNICTVLEKYSDVLLELPCDLIFCIFMAATIQLRRYRQGGPDAVHAQQCLQLCVHWLTVLGKSWKSAEARHQLLKERIEHPQDSTTNTSRQTTPGLQDKSGAEILDEDALGLFLSSFPETVNIGGFDWISNEDWDAVQNQLNVT